MTSRGNPSISPPVQIPLQSQPRQVNFSSLPSGTPPPQQQFYTGQTQVQPAGVYDYIPQGGQAQGPPQFMYQAYGSAPNDLRAGVGAGRGGGGVQQHHQVTNGMFPPQPGQQSMRPQQPAAGQPTYFIGNVRQQRPTQMMFVPPNVVIQPTSMYQPRMPHIYPPNQQFPTFAGNYQPVYYPPAPMSRGTLMNPQNPSRPGPPPREKKIIAIKDPTSGRNIDLKEELSHDRPHSNEQTDQAVEEPVAAQPAPSDIANEFARQVAKLLKNPESAGGEMVEGYTANGGEYQAGPPPQQPPPGGAAPHNAQMPHPAMVRPPMQPMMTAQAPLQPGHMLPPHQAMDLSHPPPQIPPPLTRPRGPAPHTMYNVAAAVPQQPQPQPMAAAAQHPPSPAPGGPRHPPTVVQPPPMMAPPAMPQQPAPLQQQQPPAPVPAAPEVIEEPNIPPRPAVAAEVRPAEPVVAEVTPPTNQKETSPDQETDDAAGANNQVKDGRKPKKTKKDFNRKDIGGSDMDAFIDSALIEEQSQQPPEPESQEAPQSSIPGEDEESNTVPEQRRDSQKKEPVSQQADSKYRQKKKKKKKGRKTPPMKGKKVVDEDSEEKSGESVESSNGKPPLPPPSSSTSSVERPSSTDKQMAPTAVTATPTTTPAAVAEKPPFSYAAAATASVTSVEPPKVKDSTPPPPPTPPAAIVEAAKPVKEVEEPQKEAVKVPEVDSIKEKLSETKPPEMPSQQKPAQAVQQPPQKPVPPPQQRQTAPQEPPQQTSSPVNDENAPPKDAKQEDAKEEPVPSKDDDGSKKPVDKAKPVKQDDAKEKLTYDRKYLMELRECASSQTKPEGLPNLDIILDKPNISPIRGTMNAPLDFTPSFFQPTAGATRHAPQIGKSSSRGRQRPDMPQQRIIKSVSIQNDVKLLHQSEKPWKPKGNAPAEGAEKKSLEADVLFIMNRLTPTNFEKLANEMKQLAIKTYDDLENLVKIFFEKVTIETKFVTAYAQLCKVLSGLKVPPPPDKGMKENQATFRVVMLTKCQQEFEADKSIIFEDPEEKRKKLIAEMEASADKDVKIEEVLYRMKLRRLKFYGNIRFIGELFKLGMLTENIMHDCIFRLLKARDDDSLLSLCNLITTVGQMLDTDKAKSRMDQYFTQMEKISEERKSRIKFTLKDAIDLRRNHWVPRKETTGPKKIDEVHKDFQQEQVRNQLLSAQPLPPRNEMPQPGSRRGSRQRQEEQKPNDDGWNTVGSKSMKIDASKMKLSKNVVDEDNIQLGPGGGSNKFSMWSRGSFGGGSQSSMDSDRPTGGNRFSALRNDEDRRNFQRSPSRGDTAGRGLRQGPTAGHGRGKIMARSSQEGERRDLLASARSIVGGGRSQNSSRDNSWNREDRRSGMGPRSSREGENVMSRSDISRPSTEDMRPPPPVTVTPAAKKVKPMSEDEMESKAKTILEEYLNIKDMDEAKLCVSELSGQPHIHFLVTASINEVLERTSQARGLTGQYLHELVRNQIITLDAYIKGLTEVLQYAEDMVIDIPMMWDNLAQVISPLLVGGSLPWTKLTAVLRPALDQRCSLTLLTKLVLQAKTLSNENEVAGQWQNSGLSWANFMAAGDVDTYLRDHKLEFTTKASSGGPDATRLGQQVETLVTQGRPSQEVKDLIEKMVPIESRDNNFIRALTTAITNASITRPELKVNEDVIKSHRGVLQTYITSPGQELQALYAIQVLMAKLEHPKGVIFALFDLLFNEELISEEALKQWESSTDPSEQEGKGACSMQLTRFFTWLRENEEVEPAS